MVLCSVAWRAPTLPQRQPIVMEYCNCFLCAAGLAGRVAVRRLCSGAAPPFLRISVRIHRMYRTLWCAWSAVLAGMYNSLVIAAEAAPAALNLNLRPALVFLLSLHSLRAAIHPDPDPLLALWEQGIHGFAGDATTSTQARGVHQDSAECSAGQRQPLVRSSPADLQPPIPESSTSVVPTAACADRRALTACAIDHGKLFQCRAMLTAFGAQAEPWSANGLRVWA